MSLDAPPRRARRPRWSVQRHRARTAAPPAARRSGGRGGARPRAFARDEDERVIRRAAVRGWSVAHPGGPPAPRAAAGRSPPQPTGAGPTIAATRRAYPILTAPTPAPPARRSGSPARSTGFEQGGLLPTTGDTRRLARCARLDPSAGRLKRARW